jgi:hypothetical protein
MSKSAVEGLARRRGQDRRLSQVMEVLNGKVSFLLLVCVWIISGLSWAWGKPEEKVKPLLVTRQVLIEYVEDRLRQLEGKENLTEEDAEELNFIRQNRGNPKSLSDFYGMEIRETQEEGVARQAEPVREPPVFGANYTVNLGSFKRKNQADRYVEELQKHGLKVFRWEVDLPGKGRWHRVCIGNFSTRKQAQLFAKELEQKGLETFVVKFSTGQEAPDTP